MFPKVCAQNKALFYDAAAETCSSSLAVPVSSFSHGFLRAAFSGRVPCPSSTVLGMSLMPGMGCPLVMSSTMWANEVGYGAGGSLALVGAGRIPAADSLGVDAGAGVGCVEAAAGGWADTGDGRRRAAR